MLSRITRIIYELDYKDLEVWQYSRKLVSSIYSITRNFPVSERFGLMTQLNRSSISVASNIAEACGRKSNKASLHFLYISRGSLFELETQLFLSFDQKLLAQEAFENIMAQILSCKKLLNGFINYHNNKITSPSTINHQPPTKQ